ncbi:MAG: S1 RNA-binding domain-containing protein [Clostridia bacterium]|nr:S1 RNA-binding domain-containing protein [Clostridia bacterium]
MKSTVSDIHSFQKGQIVDGIIEKIKPYGAFVKIYNSDISGIIYKEDISKMYINNPADRFNIGDSVRLLVKRYDRNTGRLVLSNDLNNFSEMISGLNVNDVVEGIVRNQYKSGVFIEIKQDLVGLADYKYGLSYGDTVNVAIKNINMGDQKIKLEILG